MDRIVRIVTTAERTPEPQFTAEDYLAGLCRILQRGELNGGRIHPEEIRKARECVTAVVEMLKVKRRQDAAEDREHALRLAENGCAHD